MNASSVTTATTMRILKMHEVLEMTSLSRATCVFQTKVATDSRRSLPPIPRESCH
jgi:hypothetical protein